MEIFELRYFLGVAQNENVHRASENLNISPGSLSKAIARLENELGVSLFYKQGRNIRLTPEGQALKKRAALIVQLEEAAKVELSGQKGTLNIVISAEEVLHTQFGIALTERISNLYPNSRFQFQIRSEGKVLEQVSDGEVHFGLITGEVPQRLKSKTMDRVEFKACANNKHPLFRRFSQAEKIPVEEILKFPFVSPESSLLGKISTSISLDGWRDDKFPRTIRYRAGGLKILEALVRRGHALAYLPDYYAKELNLVLLSISGCPYKCNQTIKVVCRDPDSLGWMSQVWGTI